MECITLWIVGGGVDEGEVLAGSSYNQTPVCAISSELRSSEH